MKLEEIATGSSLAGVEPTEIVSVVALLPVGHGAAPSQPSAPAHCCVDTASVINPTGTGPVGVAVASKPRAFHATAEIPAPTAKMRLVEIAEEIVSVLASDPNPAVRLVVEISVVFPEGASESMKRADSENASSLGIKKADWE